MSTETLIFNPRVTRNDGHPYIDRYGDQWNLDTVQNAEPFASQEAAQTYIVNMGWQSWATTTPFPVDEYFEEE